MRYTRDGSIIILPSEFHNYFDVELYSKLNDATLDARPVELIVTLGTFIGTVMGKKLTADQLNNCITALSGIIQRTANLEA